MSSIAEGKPIQQAIRDQRTKKWNMPTNRGACATDSVAACEGYETKRRKKVLHQREPRSENSTVSERSTSEARAESEKREIEIREHVFSISLPGVEITHCNFGKTRVEVWYVTDKTDGDKVEEKLQKNIGSHVEPYKLKLVKKAGLPTFKYTSPGQSTSLRRACGSIGAYVTLTDKDRCESKLHAVVSGHGKVLGDRLYFNLNPDQPIGEVRVAKEDTRKRSVANCDLEHHVTNSFDVGLVLMDEQQLDRHETSVTTELGRIKLARVEAAIHPRDMVDDQNVMLFNSDNKQGTVCFQNYNSRNTQKFGMIAIAQQPGEEKQAVHGMNESGTLVVALPPYQENGVKRVKAVGMLVGIEEFRPSPESISLAVPIGTNLQELIEDDYCVNKEIQFA